MSRGPRPGPIHVVVGEDTYIAEVALERILTAAIGDEREDALQVLYGDEKRWETVLAVARTGSLFASRRAVVVRRAELLRYERAPSEGAEAAETPEKRPRTKADEDLVAAYLEGPVPDVTLVLMAAKPDRRRNPWKRLLSKATVHDAAPKKGRALRGHVEAELRQRGLRITVDGVSELIDRVGQDLRRLMGEVDKLEAFAGQSGTLGAEEVASVLGRGMGRPLYLLSDAVAARDAGKSLELIDELMGEGEEGLRVLATLHRSLRQVRGARAMREARVARDEIAGRLLPPNMQFKLDGLLEASRRWSEEDLRRAFAALGRADRRLKRSVDAETALVAALVEACGTGEGARPSSPRRGR